MRMGMGIGTKARAPRAAGRHQSLAGISPSDLISRGLGGRPGPGWDGGPRCHVAGAWGCRRPPRTLPQPQCAGGPRGLLKPQTPISPQGILWGCEFVRGQSCRVFPPPHPAGGDSPRFQRTLGTSSTEPSWFWGGSVPAGEWETEWGAWWNRVGVNGERANPTGGWQRVVRARPEGLELGVRSGLLGRGCWFGVVGLGLLAWGCWVFGGWGCWVGVIGMGLLGWGCWVGVVGLVIGFAGG